MDHLKVKAAVKQFVERCMAQHSPLPRNDGYRSTGLAAIDAVFSANSRYGAVLNIIQRIKPALEKVDATDPEFAWFDLDYLLKVHDNVRATYPESSPENALADHLYFNRAVIGGNRKSLVVESLARRIHTAHNRIPRIESRLNHVAEFDVLWSRSNRLVLGDNLIADLQKVSGIGPATARYFLLLIGGPYVKPDVMTMRFVSRVLGREVSPDETSRLLERAINELINEEGWQLTVPQVDHLIWLWESGRLHLD